jgi:hypothetical protein
MADLSPEQAVDLLASLVGDDRLRFLNKREHVAMDTAVYVLRSTFKPAEDEGSDELSDECRAECEVTAADRLEDE